MLVQLTSCVVYQYCLWAEVQSHSAALQKRICYFDNYIFTRVSTVDMVLWEDTRIVPHDNQLVCIPCNSDDEGNDSNNKHYCSELTAIYNQLLPIHEFCMHRVGTILLDWTNGLTRLPKKPCLVQKGSKTY